MRLRFNQRFITLSVLILGLLLISAMVQAWIIPVLSVTGRFLAGPITSTVMWLGRAASSNPTMSKAVEWSIVSHGAVIGSLWFGKKDQKANEPVYAKVIVSPKKDQPTVNPDPSKYDNEASASDPLQPKPKSSFSSKESSISKPKSFLTIVQEIGGEGESKWYENSSNSDIRYLVVFAPDYVHAGQKYENSCHAPALRVIPNGYDGKAWCGKVSGIAREGNYQIYDVVKKRTCPTGYMLGNGDCVLQNAAIVTKPDKTVSCEITRKSDNTWYIDPKNPECAALASSITQSEDKKKITINNGAGQTATITDNDDGTRDYDFQDGDSWRNIKTGTYDQGLGGRAVKSITDGTGNNPGGTAGGGGGGGGGGGSGGGSGGSCGGAGQPPCSIDDSGFDGKSTDGNGLLEKIDSHDKTIKDKIGSINAGDNTFRWNQK